MEVVKSKKQPDDKVEKHGEDSHKGTVFSVGVLAAVIVLMWIGVFWLYMERV